jgi:hypothetical protein
MSEDELPPNIREKVDSLRKGEHQRVVDRLLERRAAGSPEERRKVDATLIELAKPSRLGWWVALVALVVGGSIAAHLISQRRYEAAVAVGTPTLAYVKRMDSGDCTIGQANNRCLRLALELHPENRGPYAAELTADIPLQWMSRVQPGSWLMVSVDPNDRSKVYFDERSMAIPPPAPAVP